MKNNSNGAFRSKHGYTVVQNEIVHDKRVSLKARGLYLTIQAYITMPGKTWLKSEFLRMVPEGEKAFNTAWNELKKAGYLKTHTYPTGGNWRHEYELLDEPMAGPHTFYYDAQGNPTKTNESRSNGETSDTDMAEGGNVDNFQHYPHFGSSADGSNAKGGSAEGSSAKGNSANGGNNINTGYKYLKTTPNDNNSDTNPSINQVTDGSIDAYEEPIILDVNKLIDSNVYDDMEFELQERREVPTEWIAEPSKLVLAIQVLANWNARVIDYKDDDLRREAYLTVVTALAHMCTRRSVQNYGDSLVSYSHVIKRLNVLAHGQAGIGEICSFIESCADKLMEAEKTQAIKNPLSYAKSLIWNNFTTCKLDFHGFFERTWRGGES